jgi:hypothetical protein
MIQIFEIYNCAKMFTFYSACILENIFSQLAEADVSETLKICCKDRQPRHALTLFPQQQQLTRFQQRQQHAKIPNFSFNNEISVTIQKFSNRNSTSNFSNRRAYQIPTTATSNQVSTSETAHQSLPTATAD